MYQNHIKFLPDYEQAAQYLRENEFDFILAKILKNNNPISGQLYSERTDPSFAYFRQGIHQNLTTRDLNMEIQQTINQKILDWCKRQVGNDSLEINSYEIILKLANKRIVVLYLGEDNEEFQIFKDVSQLFPMKCQFIHSFDKNLKQEFGNNKIIVLKKFEDLRNNFNEKYEYKNILKFISYHSRQAVIGPQFGFNHAYVRDEPVLFLIYGKDAQLNYDATQELRKACIKLKPYIIMSIADLTTEFGFFFNQKMNEQIQEKPVFILTFKKNNIQRKYRMLRENLEENIIAFFNQYKNEIDNLQKDLFWESSAELEKEIQKQDL